MQFARQMCSWPHEMPYSPHAVIWFVNAEIARACWVREWIEVKIAVSKCGLTVNGFLFTNFVESIHVVFDLLVRAFSDYWIDWTRDSVIIAWFRTDTVVIRFRDFWILQEEIDAARRKVYVHPPWRSTYPNSPGHRAAQYLTSFLG